MSLARSDEAQLTRRSGDAVSAARRRGAESHRGIAPALALHPMKADVESLVAALRKRGSKRGREAMARFGIVSNHAFGVSVPEIRGLAKEIGRNHRLATALWDTGIHEARILTAFIAEPTRLTAAQMDRWAADFDNWAICDTLCIHLFDQTPHAWAKIERWSIDEREFVKRAAFALLASIARHDKTAEDERFLASLPLIKLGASDERNFVKKAVSWALRGIGKRNRTLNTAAVELARRLADSTERAPQWVGKDALKELTGTAVVRRLRG